MHHAEVLAAGVRQLGVITDSSCATAAQTATVSQIGIRKRAEVQPRLNLELLCSLHAKTSK
jgi:hypothetical protein